MRPSGRANDEMRELRFTRSFTCHAEGSVLAECGATKVLCTVSIDNRIPPWLRGSRKGWLTAEYGLLPRATHTRNGREAVRGKQSGRTLEIQRLIGRSLRAVMDLGAIGEKTITIDCDVLGADGGTRTASITGACLALWQALEGLVKAGELSRSPLRQLVTAVSVGIVDGDPCLDLEYEEDVSAEVDLNVAALEDGRIVEVQGTAEGAPFGRGDLDNLLTLAESGIRRLVEIQREAVKAAR